MAPLVACTSQPRLKCSEKWHSNSPGKIINAFLEAAFSTPPANAQTPSAIHPKGSQYIGLRFALRLEHGPSASSLALMLPPLNAVERAPSESEQQSLGVEQVSWRRKGTLPGRL